VSVARSLTAALLLCALVSLATLAARWGAENDEFDRAGARAFAQAALEDAGLDDVEVAARVEPTDYRPETFAPDDPPLRVFRTTAKAAGGDVELFVHAPSGRAVYLRDVATGGGPLLDDDQYRRLRDFAWRDEAEAAEQRRLAGAAATALVVASAIGGALLVRREMMAP
jgi:hypothetical protein